MATHYSVGVHHMVKIYSVQVIEHMHFIQKMFFWSNMCLQNSSVHNLLTHVRNWLLGAFHKLIH